MSEKTSLETENERIVTQFCLDWAKRDADLLVEYLAEDIEYQMYEGRPDINGHEEFKKEMGGWLKGLKEVDWEINRQYSVGELVINERVDHFISDDPKKTFHLPIAGVFLVRDGKIKMWKDYSLPGDKS
ncbi:MAG: limonene-1,2-epoxide hydrolase family protein [Gammaproteobacteria bacterium]